MGVRVEFIIDGNPGALAFVGPRVARDHMQGLIDFFGPRLTLGRFVECPSSAEADTASRREVSLLPPGGVLSPVQEAA